MPKATRLNLSGIDNGLFTMPARGASAMPRRIKPGRRHGLPVNARSPDQVIRECWGDGDICHRGRDCGTGSPPRGIGAVYPEASVGGADPAAFGRGAATIA